MATTGKLSNYRATLTVPRSATDIVALGCRIYVTVGDDTERSSINDYTESVTFAPESQAILEGDQVSAQVKNGDIIVADTTDKIDKIWITQPADFNTGFEDKVRLAYDNGNGGINTAPALYDPGNFNTVQTDTDSTLSQITFPGRAMKAAGVLYGDPESRPPMYTYFWKSKANAQDSDVRFWMLLDEPDEGNGDQMKSLPDIYDLYYQCNEWADKPYSINIANPTLYEEYYKGADILISNPWVKHNARPGADISRRISDAVAEMNRSTGGTKKVILCLWWWSPNIEEPDPNNAENFNDTFDKAIRAGADGVAGWNFSGSYNGEARRLSTYTEEDVPKLWTAIGQKNKSIS